MYFYSVIKEHVILVDKNDNQIGLMEKMEAHRRALLHRAFSVFILNTTSANTSGTKNKFYSSIENFLNGNFENTDFSIKSREGIKPEIGILTFKPLFDTEDGLNFFHSCSNALTRSF